MRSGKDDALIPISELLPEFLKSLDYSKVEKNTSIQTEWQRVVPKEFIDKTKTLNKTDDGTLFVACENSFVTNELFMQKQDILANLDESFGIKNIVFSHKAWKNNA